MEYNKNKLIFFAIGGVLLLIFLFLALQMGKNGNKAGITSQKGPNDFSIWMVGEKTDTNTFITSFKNQYPSYKSKNISIEVFSDYKDYSYALTSAFGKGLGPDIFVLSSGEKKSVFEDYAYGINPELLTPADFRKRYKTMFADDLITIDPESKIEFVKGLPVGYETLGIYFNAKKVRALQLASISGLDKTIKQLKKGSSVGVPIAIGNGSTVPYAADIATQFLIMEKGITGIDTVSAANLKTALNAYLRYGYDDGDNEYNKEYESLLSSGKDAYDLFSRSETSMVIGYPRALYKIKEKGYASRYLQVVPFPSYYPGEGKTFSNYNYFVTSKSTKNTKLAADMLGYLSTDAGVVSFLQAFPYMLPALDSAEKQILQQKIDPKYTVVLENFINPKYELVSFNKGLVNLYNEQMELLLDNGGAYDGVFSKFIEGLNCRVRKIETLSGFENSCDV